MSQEGWRPISTAPKTGKFLVARYAPTNWSYTVSTVFLHDYGNSERDKKSMWTQRRIALQYARAWMPIPDEPSKEIQAMEASHD